MSKRQYIQRRPRYYLDVDADLIPSDFAAEDSNHPRVYMRAPTWGDRDAAYEHADADDGIGIGIALLARCLDSIGGDFGFCLHPSTRDFVVPDGLDERIAALRTLGIPDLAGLTNHIEVLCSPSEEQVGESVAPAG
jgi:hypothetical protein